MQEKLLKISVLGVGGCGNNILADIYKDLSNFKDKVDFYALNTDVQALNLIIDTKQFPKELAYQIGERTTKGMGAGSKPDVGKSAAQEDIELIRTLITGKDLLIIITGIGGGTGSGVTPEVLREAKELDVLTIVFTIKPSDYEGLQRNKIAKDALKEIKEMSDTFITIHNDASESLIFKDSLDEINSAVSMGIQVILDVITNPSVINLDFADFTTIVKNGSKGYFSYASFDGDKRDERVVKELARTALQPKTTLKRVRKAVMFVRGGSDMRKDEIKTVVGGLRDKLADDSLVIMGVALKENKTSLDAVFLGVTGDKDE